MNQTKIAIIGGDSAYFVTDVTLFVAEFAGIAIDFHRADGKILLNGNDFILREFGTAGDVPELQNIILSTESSPAADFARLLTYGSVLLYPAEGNEISGFENSVRVMSYSPAASGKQKGTLFLTTEFGNIEVKFPEKYLAYTDAAKILCQLIGIQQEIFYEAISLYS